MNVLKGLVEKTVKDHTGWKEYAFGDFTKSVIPGTGDRVVDRWNALVPASLPSFPEEEQSKVWIVGDGPVALWTAIQIRLRAPLRKVIVRGKHATYARNHVVMMKETTLETPLIHQSMVLRQMIDGMHSGMTIREMHDRMLALADLLGVTMDRGKAVTEEEILQQQAKGNVIIGADGSHSIVRKVLFNDALCHYEGAMYAIEVKYVVEGQGSSLSGMQKYALIKACHRLVNEHVSTHDEIMNITRVCLRFVVTGEEYVAFSGATFATPWTFSSSLPPSVAHAIRLWLGARQHYVQEKRIRMSERITSFTLAPYKTVCFTKCCALTSDQVALVGDAAFGVPFFESLHHGLRCGTVLAHVLTSEEHTLADYESYASLAADTAIATAKGKRSLLETASLWCDVSSYMPWQIITLDVGLVEEWATQSFQ